MNHTFTHLALSAMILVAGLLGAVGGYEFGYSRATLEAQVLLARKDAEAAAARPAAAAKDDAPAPKKKAEFAPSALSAADLAEVDGLGALSGNPQENALYALNNIPGSCAPCADTGKSLGQCLLDTDKLIDKSNCANIAGLTRRVVKLASAGKSIDAIRAAADLGVWYPLDPADAPSKGPAAAPITIIEYSDFQCPFCKKSQDNVHAVEQKYAGKIRLVFMNQPLQMHAMALPAAKAAMAADLQGKFWPFHDALFTAPKLDEEQLGVIAASVGVDVGRWNQDRASAAVDRAVSTDVQRASKYGISSTPTFFVNGYKIKGAQPPPAFEKIIEAELADRG